MNHAEHDESIGSMLAGIATALREVSDKLDIVAARVQQDVPTFPSDEDLPDKTRIHRLESWAFHASQDISRLSSRLDALDGGDSDPARPVRGTRSRREVREAAEAAERAADGFDDAEPLLPQQDRDAQGLRPPLERRHSPAKPSTDHLGDPTALGATPMARGVTEGGSPFGQPIPMDTESLIAVGRNGNGLSTAGHRPARLGGGATVDDEVGSAPGRTVSNGTGSTDGDAARGSVRTGTAANGTGSKNEAAVGTVRTGTASNEAVSRLAGDIATPRNVTAVPAVIGTVVPAPEVDRAADSRPLEVDRAADSRKAEGDTSLPGSVDVAAHVATALTGGRAVDSPAETALTSDAGVSLPVEEQTATAAQPTVNADVGIERARPVKKPAVSSPDLVLDVPLPEGLSNNGNGAARLAVTDIAHAESGRLPSAPMTVRPSEPPAGSTTGDRSEEESKAEAANGFGQFPHTAPKNTLSNGTPARPNTTGETPARLSTSDDVSPTGTTSNGIRWSFSDDTATTSPPQDRNGLARNGFTTDSARRSDTLFGDFTPRERLTTGSEDSAPAVSVAPARLTPPSNPAPVDPTSSDLSDGVGIRADHNGTALTDNTAVTHDAPLTNNAARTTYAPLTTNTSPGNHDRPAAGFDPPTLDLPVGRDLSKNPPRSPEPPVADPAPPTATDAAGITVTGTYRAFDIERAHVDKLQAMLDELKRSAGLPPGRRDVFGPPTPERG
ncbi:hypothetical protein ACFWU5_14745 [Nocardia sp. NPDC058640]|uniref:hypothetical protein n=1 Tax=Nocardia sp. NPDC058640 TaxID=3346571 RepID=UPI0036625EEA